MAGRRVVGPPYEVAVRLTAIAADHWEAIDGEAALRGIGSYLELPPVRFYNAILSWCLKHVKDTDRFMAKLTAPVPGRVRQASDEDLQREREDFAAFASAVGMHQQTVKSPG